MTLPKLCDAGRRLVSTVHEGWSDEDRCTKVGVVEVRMRAKDSDEVVPLMFCFEHFEHLETMIPMLPVIEPLRWTIIDSRDGRRLTLATFADEDRARDAIAEARRQVELGHRPDLAESIDYAVPTKVGGEP